MKVPLYDTHCHFDFPPFLDEESASICRAAQAGVEKILIPATQAHRFCNVLKLAERYPPLYAALGLHPVFIHEHSDDALNQLEQYLRLRPEKLVAMGEIGLDLYITHPLFERQVVLFEAQLTLAKHYDLPVLLHSRRTHDKMASILKRHLLPRAGVIHGFAGSLQQAERFVALNYFIGVGGTITWPRAQKTRGVIARLPLETLVLETDAPDMPLAGRQGMPNRPEYAADVFQVLCELRPEKPERIAQALKQNADCLFRW